MSKILFLGDPHVQPSNIEESSRLMDFVIESARNASADVLIIAGDLFHTHAVIRMEVLNFWSKYILEFSKVFKDVHILVGNHDQIGDRQREGQISALDSFIGKHENVNIWAKAGVYNGLGFIPYTSDSQLFLSTATELFNNGAKRLFCHQTFDGSKYDNGFYAPDGIDGNLLPPFEEVVSGHIHSTQEIGNVFYPGTPKWDTLSDANQKKSIWVSVASRNWQPISTESVCRPIIKITIKESESKDVSIDIKENALNMIELIGSSSWIGRISKKFKGSVRVIARPTDSVERKKESKVFKSIFDYMESYDKISSDKKLLKKYLSEMGV
jgi:DNA repair exonuclease SbcCD nuclease subunit